MGGSDIHCNREDEFSCDLVTENRTRKLVLDVLGSFFLSYLGVSISYISAKGNSYRIEDYLQSFLISKIAYEKVLG